jgi:hypothetical protein
VLFLEKWLFRLMLASTPDTLVTNINRYAWHQSSVRAMAVNMSFDSLAGAFAAIRKYEEEMNSHFVIVKRRKSGILENLL